MITVLGSINVDLTVTVDEIPGVGETFLGNDFNQYPGGKGANQAVAAALLGHPVTFLGKVGDDTYGTMMLKQMSSVSININYIEVSKKNPTGVALICVDSRGGNNIVVIQGAGKEIDSNFIRKNQDIISKSDILLAQLEISIESVTEAFRIAKNNSVTTILNPAPARDLPDELISLVDILVPNEHELQRISGIETQTSEGLKKAAKVVLDKGVKNLVVTLGSRGAMYISEGIHEIFPAYNVKSIDTTGAGDGFLGGFSYSYVKDGDIIQAIKIGQAVAALSIQKKGAQSSLPTFDELNKFLGC